MIVNENLEYNFVHFQQGSLELMDFAHLEYFN